MKELIFVTIQMPLAMAVEARTEASKRNLSRSELLREAIKLHLERLEKNKPARPRADPRWWST